MSMEERTLPSGEVFFGKLFQSPDGNMMALRNAGGCCEGRFRVGRVCVFSHDAFLYEPQGFIRPGHVAVSDAGEVIVGDALRNTGALHCRVTVHASSGRLRFSKAYGRNCGGVGISGDGSIAIFGTANPRSCIRVLNLAQDPPTEIAKIDGYGFFSSASIDLKARSIVLDIETTINW